jgi:CHAD domain-containing protein
VKARKVKGVAPGDRFDDAAERIVRTRLDELCAFMPQAADPAEDEAQHDMRIAAKRLRYALDLTAACFGPYAPQARKEVKRLQAVLGEIHDCDVLLERVGDAPQRAPIADALRARRADAHGRFAALWRELGRDGFRARLEFAAAERPEPPAFDHDSITSL